MSLSKEMIQEATKYVKANEVHPFVQGLINGTLKQEQIDYYDEQDIIFEYNEISIINALINSATNTEQVQIFRKRQDFQINVLDKWLAREPKNRFHDWQGMQNITVQPMNQLYQYHMSSTIKTNSVLQILPSFVAGEWLYIELGKYMQTQNRVKEEPFAGFLELTKDRAFIGEDGFINQFFRIIDYESATATEAAKQKAKQTFLKSCLLEWYFWEDAYHLTTWQDWSVNEFKNIK